ncbi:MAG: hypothetical protein ACKV22_34795 [Bryobacteraceae bacterium]
MRKTLAHVAALGVLCAVGWSDDKAKAGQQVTGCLTKGAQAGEFILTDEKSGERMIAAGSPDLEKHAANHKVKVTGSREPGDGKQVFKVTSIEHVSDTCVPAVK